MGHASLCYFLCRLFSLGTDLGRGQKGSLKRAATARTAGGKNGRKVRRHSIDRLDASTYD